MKIVVDATLLVPLIQKDARSPAVSRAFQQWFEAGAELHLPELALYETASALTRLVRAGWFPNERLAVAWSKLTALPLVYHRLRSGPRAVEIALTLGRKSAYDAAYLVLAEELEAEVWTLDGPLYRNAASQGMPVRRLEVGE